MKKSIIEFHKIGTNKLKAYNLNCGYLFFKEIIETKKPAMVEKYFKRNFSSCFSEDDKIPETRDN